MSEPPGAVTTKLRISSKLDPERPLAPHTPISRFYTALVTGDLRSLQVLTERYHLDVNLVFEISKNELEWQVKSQASYGLSGLWALEERWELSTPLCLAARHGHPDCLRHLLRRGADPNLAPGGQAPLHWACQGGHSHCLELLLEYRADPNLRSDEGMAPLHLCTSPGSLRKVEDDKRWSGMVEGGQSIQGQSRVVRMAKDSPSMHDADPGAEGDIAQTTIALPVEGTRSQCHTAQPVLLPPKIPELHSPSSTPPLHPSCLHLKNPPLERGANANAIDYDGVSPLGWALLGAAAHRDRRPHVTVQLLLNHGSQRIWPPAFGKVLKSCAAVPEVIEVLFNSYSQIPVSQEWAQAMPEEVFQQHQPFYQSVLGLAGRARCLQHLCRSAIRARLGGRCHSLIP
ncbi:ASB18 protein, partial [Sterrhoptilus dennistouni]|nr:ASB18 protein [Sterrhoptilus dennistouni]